MRFERSGRALTAVALAVASYGCSAFSNPSGPSYRSIRQLVESQHIRSISSLLTNLPDSYLSHHALVFETRSPQEATFVDPRAIVYGADGTFVIAFNGSSDQLGFSSLDTMEFDRRTASFVLREITFPEGNANAQPKFSEDNPPSCAPCHGGRPRPIWDSYPLWPGAYGERAGAEPSERERRGLAEFAAARGSNPRYVRLTHRAPRVADAKALAYNGGRERTPNAELGAFLSHWNAEAVVHEVVGSPRIVDYRYALLASFASPCVDIDAVPRRVEASFAESYRGFTVEARREHGLHQDLETSRTLSSGQGPVRDDPFALNRFRYLAEIGMGLTKEAWSIAFEREAYEPAAPGFASLFVERLSAREPKLRHLFDEAKNGDCRELQRRSLTQLSSPVFAPLEATHTAPDSHTSFDSNPMGTHARPVAALVDICMSCHAHGVGPPIPFSDRAALAFANRHTRYPHGTLLAEIVSRLNPAAGARRMPLGVDLSKDETTSLETYFRSAVRDDDFVAGEAP